MRRYGEPRARPATIVVVVILALVALASGVVAAFDSDSALAHRPLPVGEGRAAAVASVHRDHRAACAAFLATSSPRFVEPRVAAQDRDALERSLMGDRPDDGVRSIGLTRCGNAEVIVVGVADDSVRVPAAGPGGTPVLVHLQSPFFAF
jgi:hypothetical protein